MEMIIIEALLNSLQKKRLITTAEKEMIMKKLSI